MAKYRIIETLIESSPTGKTQFTVQKLQDTDWCDLISFLYLGAAQDYKRRTQLRDGGIVVEE